MLRNRLFERLVVTHGFRAITIESSFPKARVVNAYVAGHGPASYEAMGDSGLSHNFAKLEANRELIEWMRRYNADPAHAVQLHFYGFDMPTGAVGIDSPRQVLGFVVDYLAALDRASGEAFRARIEPLLGQDAAWDNPEAYMDPSKSIGLSPQANALRLATEDLISELHRRRPELIAQSDAAQFAEAFHYGAQARQLLNYHAAHARGAGVGELLGIRDALMADNLAYTVAREQGRGKVLVFAHNAHLQRGKLTVWPAWQRALNAETFAWWPAGAHVDRMIGPRYAVISTALGVSEANEIALPEAGTLEALLMAAPGPGRFIPTHRGQGLPQTAIASLPVRSDSSKNMSYVPLTQQSFTDFDWLAVLDSSTYQRGGPPLP